ncbi:alpha/beta hydrolase (plasmid) [Rhizobium grahamii]|uniref:Alpha/beta hydrolase n=1 Tax=Rhizobium grahamii TaxID=1120045 RepID=A0A5Q0CDF3_9HYPH|nr:MULTISPECIES: alpha/beta hydrolase [Rhizobium]QFY63403.1 alpha/beta hydrolase [Rhizobium grahamii]QRM51832.1 alpha/beta hydrolase [Rhizobium sp. BG6]
MRSLILCLMLATATMTTATAVSAAPATATADTRKAPVPVHYRTANIEGIDIFYREAGPADAPVVLLLHGFPTSSHMFRNLIPLLADRYHVIAPDYPGYGQSAAPDHEKFAYTFAGTTNIVDKLLDHLAVKSYAMYVMDYGAPVGYRLALKHPERVSGLIIQNGNAYDEGLKEFWDPIKTYWSDGSTKSREALNGLVTLETTKFQYTDGMEDVSRISPDNWVHDQALLDRPGNRDIQLDMLYDYRTNLPLYPDFQNFFRERKPPTLIIWGKNDYIFPEAGAHPYLRDLPNAEVHILNSGHFLLEEKLDVAAPLINDFLDRNIASK